MDDDSLFPAGNKGSVPVPTAIFDSCAKACYRNISYSEVVSVTE